MERPYRIVIWGAGWKYYSIANTVFRIVEKGQAEVLGIMADSLPPSGTLDGFPILPKSALLELDFDYLILCVKDPGDELISLINNEYGIPRERIIKSSVLSFPHFDFEKYMQLRESNLTIVSNLCWGGFMYKMLDLRCSSPFRNLYICSDHYFRLLADLEGHCAQEPVFSRFDLDSSGFRHPVMLLGDSELHFNHVKTPEEALFEWNKRLERINWDNLFIMFYTESKEEELAFNALDAYEKRICFVPYQTDAPHSLYPHETMKERPFFSLVNVTGVKQKETYAYDPIRLLLGDSDYARYLP